MIYCVIYNDLLRVTESRSLGFPLRLAHCTSHAAICYFSNAAQHAQAVLGPVLISNLLALAVSYID